MADDAVARCRLYREIARLAFLSSGVVADVFQGIQAAELFSCDDGLHSSRQLALVLFSVNQPSSTINGSPKWKRVC